MRKIFLPAILLPALLVAAPGASSSGSAQDKKSYPLVCRGGGTIYNTMRTDPISSVAGFQFKKGARSADSGLEPGECSWVDRGLREAEPDALVQLPDTGKKIDYGWISKLQGADSYWQFDVYNNGTRFLVTDSKPYRGKSVDPSRPAFEAPVSRAEVDRAGVTREETVRVPELEPNTNRPGLDYKSFEIADIPELCQQACNADPKCKAFTFVRSGVQGRRAMCWLKSGVPAASTSDCCVSGVKRSSSSGLVRPEGTPLAGSLVADVAPRPDLPMFVAANSGKIVFLADMNGTGWNDYLREPAHAIHVDDSGVLYYLSGDYNRLITRENKMGGSPQTLDMQVPINDFNFDSAGRVLAASSQEHCIVSMNSFNGGGFARFGSKGSGVGQFNGPQGVAMDSQDRIYVVDTGNHRIIRVDAMDGSGWVTFGSYGSGPGHFNAPWKIWIDKKDRIYVADMFNGRIVRIDDMDGSSWATYGGLDSPRFVTTDKFNRVYVADPESDKVIRIDDMTGKGKRVLQFKRDTSSLEALNRPGSLAGPAAIVVLKPAQSSGGVR